MCVWAGGVWAWDITEHGGGRASLARGTQEALNARLKRPIWLDRNQGAWAGCRGWGSRRELRWVEWKVGSTKGRKSTELQVLAGLPGSAFGLAGYLG